MASVKLHRRRESSIDNIIFDTICHEDKPQFWNLPYNHNYNEFGRNGTLELYISNSFMGPQYFYLRDEIENFEGPVKI